jgi:hypothetical protein
MASMPRSWPPSKGLPKDEAGNFIASQEKSDVVHDSPGLPGGENAGDEYAFGLFQMLFILNAPFSIVAS